MPRWQPTPGSLVNGPLGSSIRRLSWRKVGWPVPGAARGFGLAPAGRSAVCWGTLLLIHCTGGCIAARAAGSDSAHSTAVHAAATGRACLATNAATVTRAQALLRSEGSISFGKETSHETDDQNVRWRHWPGSDLGCGSCRCSVRIRLYEPVRLYQSLWRLWREHLGCDQPVHRRGPEPAL